MENPLNNFLKGMGEKLTDPVSELFACTALQNNPEELIEN
jgi:hypothetical protein